MMMVVVMKDDIDDQQTTCKSHMVNRTTALYSSSHPTLHTQLPIYLTQLPIYLTQLPYPSTSPSYPSTQPSYPTCKGSECISFPKRRLPSMMTAMCRGMRDGFDINNTLLSSLSSSLL